ncbi:MAG: DNA polymerase-3 subunit gamma/tau [Cycloclasticus pugetii]|jgi:DNA polymerase-3 subunit gamma/tau|uniref:DNA polymerase III subunit gamma/tau n=1 Tax=Cycloclasticus zancles 78-ME TaxID=1198232 RepID=S5TEE2_9GAMM|nr:DNA polymerase III subunit gamma/tau [Cycloclasticus zancles]AGS39227.1 DNA polymerase III subunit gamma/tau [Cycloclasticus zancles 78-ME]
MSYKVFARKWRPLNFAQVVGQEHIVRALVNGLENDRLHHAYLFTGTRGVGKTTIARVLAKALNCPNLTNAEPCGECETCLEVDQGCYPDLIEVDAASRTGVDDTRDLLENVQYMPSRGKYKVYLIDEVHMFSKSSFNALLKTLEEPPAHVKFLLATTDPQKMPVTVLSRCLQFNLKRLSPDQIEGQFKLILESEGIAYQQQATELLARAADGSMRDGLSLLDQAIVHGNGELNEADVIDMLGSVAREPVLDLLKALLTQQGSEVLASIQTLDEFAPDYAEVLQSLLIHLHQIAVCQIVGTDAEDKALAMLAQQLSKEDVQLYYQIALMGQKDLPLAPTPKVGFEMVLLRMLAFAPVDIANGGDKPIAQASLKPKPPVAAQKLTEVAAVPKKVTVEDSKETGKAKKAPKLIIPEKKTPENIAPVTKRPVEPVSVAKKAAPTALIQPVETVKPAANVDLPWHELVPTLGLDPMTLQLANNATLVKLDEHVCELMLMDGHVSLNKKSELNLEQALSDYYGRKLQLQLTEGAKDIVTPNSIANDKVAERQRQAEQEVRNNPAVKKIIELFDATIIEGSIKPID